MLWPYVMGWQHNRRLAERVKRATERQRTPQPSPKPVLKNLGAVRHCVINAAIRSFSGHESREDEPAPPSLWRRGGGSACSCSPISLFGVSILERACAAIFSRRKKKSRSHFSANSIPHNKWRRVYFVCRKGHISPSGAVVRARCDWLISRMCATPLNFMFLKSYDVPNKCGFESAPSL